MIPFRFGDRGQSLLSRLINCGTSCGIYRAETVSGQ